MDLTQDLEREVSEPSGSTAFLNSTEGSEKGGEKGLERMKSSLRLQYEAQVRVIRSQIGDLEKIRTELGLSQRKMAQLLLVDPSAWTRWTRPGEEAPPHVWRALQWYLSLQEKTPALSPSTFLFAGARFPQEKALQRLESEVKNSEIRVRQLEEFLEEVRAQQIDPADHQAALRQIEFLQNETQRLRRWVSFGVVGMVGLGVLFLLLANLKA